VFNFNVELFNQVLASFKLINIYNAEHGNTAVITKRE